MAKPTHITVTVSGKGSFPTDMLRYDTCYPATSRDASAIEDTFRNPTAPWSINVTRPNTRYFTVGRWESFGCKVNPA